MLLIYSHTVSKRLQYTCSFIFKELLGVECKLIIDSEKFKTHEGPKLNYSNAKLAEDEFRIENHPLLFEHDIKEQATKSFSTHGYTAFFKVADCDMPFDILAASFYLISRYEEYLPHEKDMYGRYACENSFAYRVGMMHIPLVNVWVNDLARLLKIKYPGLPIQPPSFHFQPTYDIDMAWSYKHKGLIRNIGGFLKSPSTERIKVLRGAIPDPFDCYHWLHRLHEQYKLQPIYFFLVAEKNGLYDKNILPYKDAMWNLVKEHARKYTVGLHPSWQSGDDRCLLKKEKEQLLAMVQVAGRVPVQGEMVQAPALCGVPTPSRQHYIRFNLPEGYQRLLAAGITDDYSMGYGSMNGFRASVASPFYWYDLEKDDQTSLRVHPFCFMDANSFYEQRQDPVVSLNELQHFARICKEVNGTLITIWHNNFLGSDENFTGWKEMYQEFISRLQQ